MKRTRNFTFAIITCMTSSMAFAVPNAVDTAWSTPQVIASAWSFGIGHDSATKIPDKTFWLMNKKRAANATDEAIIMIYSARQIVEHGGYFCATQARSRNKGTKGCPKIWTQYQNPNGNFEKTCLWLCEPGYSGEGCTSGTITSESECKYTKLSKDVIRTGISYNESGGYDDASVEGAMAQNTYQGFFRFGHGNTAGGNELDVILAAKEFLKNGHGIIASPVTVAAHGGMWTRDDYADSWTDCKYGDSNLTITAKTANYTTKTLCMPGFDGPGCTTSVCTECDDPLTKFNAQKGVCSDCIENHVHDKSGKCVPCGAGEVAIPEKDICLKCEKTEQIKDGKCVPRRQVSKQDMYKCYPNSDTTDFALCTNDKCPIGKTVKCLTDDKKLGAKECVSGKWGQCTEQKITPKFKKRK